MLIEQNDKVRPLAKEYVTPKENKMHNRLYPDLYKRYMSQLEKKKGLKKRPE